MLPVLFTPPFWYKFEWNTRKFYLEWCYEANIDILNSQAYTSYINKQTQTNEQIENSIAFSVHFL